MHYCKNDILGYFIASFVPSNSVEVTKEEYDEYIAQQKKENDNGTEMPN